MLDGCNVTVTVAANQQAADVVTQYGYNPATDKAPMANVDWDVVAEPSLAGRSALIVINSVPTELADKIEAFEVKVDGSTPRVLPMGALDYQGTAIVDARRVIRISGRNPSAVRLRIVWRQEADRVTNTRSDWSAPKTVSGQVGAASVEILADATTVAAYEGVSLSAVAKGFDAIFDTKELHYVWDYGDPGSTHKRAGAPYTAIYGVDANVSYDKLGGHCWETPGVKTVTCTVTDKDGNQAIGTLQITVEDPDTFFDEIVFIHPAGGAQSSDTVIATAATHGIPAQYDTGAYLAYQDIGQATFTYRNSARVLILIARGHTVSNANFRRPVTNRYQVRAYGTGADPIFDIANDTNIGGVRFGEDTGPATQEVASLVGLSLQGGYDPTIPTSRPSSGIEMFRNMKLSCHDCEIVGCDAGIEFSGVTVVTSTLITDWSNYGVFSNANGGSGQMRFIGSTIPQNALVLRREGKNESEDPFYADHGPFRVSAPPLGYDGSIGFIQTTLASFNTWGDINTVQLPQRINAFGVSGAIAQMSQCYSEGGAMFYGPTAGFDGAASVDFKVSKCLHICAVGQFGGVAFGGIVYENNIHVFGAQAIERNPLRHFNVGIETHDPSSLSSGDGFNQFARNRPNKGLAYTQPIVFRSNLFVDLRAALPGNWEGSYPTEANTFTNILNANNEIHGPNLGAGYSAIANIDLTSKFTPYYQGRRAFGENGDALQTQYSNAANGFIPVPLADCPLIGAATGTLGEEIPLDDFTGALRTSVLAGLTRNVFSSGPFEPALELPAVTATVEAVGTIPQQSSGVLAENPQELDLTPYFAVIDQVNDQDEDIRIEIVSVEAV